MLPHVSLFSSPMSFVDFVGELILLSMHWIGTRLRDCGCSFISPFLLVFLYILLFLKVLSSFFVDYSFNQYKYNFLSS